LALRPGRIAAVAVFLLAAGTAGRAEASCGDWLAGHESMPGHVAQNGDRPLPGAPCDGPNCRRSREHAPAVPPAPSRPFDGPERWCRLVEELASRPPLSSLLPPEADLPPVCGFEPRVERPPRA
jgi:hypothetical protein